MLEDVKKELEEQLEAALKAEQEPEQEEIEDGVQEGQNAEAEEVEPEAKEEAKEEPQDDKGAARLRREAAAERKKREELEARLAALEAKPEADKEEVAEIPPALQEIVQEHTKQKAWQEMEAFEAQVRAENPDYDAVAQAYGTALAQSFKMLNPNLTPLQLVAMTKDKIIQDAGALFRAGHENPAHEMYLRAKEMGFKASAPEPKEEAPKKPDMAKLAANRARSAGMAGASGESKGTLSPHAAADLSVGEFAKLSKEEKARLFSELENRMAMGQ